MFKKSNNNNPDVAVPKLKADVEVEVPKVVAEVVPSFDPPNKLIVVT